MLKYIFKRILMMIPVLIGVSIIVFMLQVLTPGDPADMALGADVTEEAKDEWRESYNLNDPIDVYKRQFLRIVIKRLCRCGKWAPISKSAAMCWR